MRARCEWLRGMKQESAFPRQDQGVHDAQDGIDGIRVRRLSNTAPTGARVPMGAEIAPAQLPHALTHLHLNVFVRVITQRRGQFYIEFKFRWKRRSYKACISRGQQLPEGRVLHVQEDRHPADFKRNVATLIHVSGGSNQFSCGATLTRTASARRSFARKRIHNRIAICRRRLPWQSRYAVIRENVESSRAGANEEAPR